MKKVLMIAAVLAAAGQKAYSEIYSARLEDSVISDTNFETNILEVPKNVTVITSKEIEERGAQTLGEALKAVPNLNVSSMNGSDSVFDLRGQGEGAKSNVLVLLDGSPLNTIDNSAYKTSMVDISSVERIEVIPSGGSVLYGDGAVGGVINIITKAPEERKNYGSVSLEGGSYNYGKVYGNYGTKIGEKLLLMGNFSKKNLDGYRDDSKDDLDDLGIAGKYLLEDGELSLTVNHSKNRFSAPGGLNKSEYHEDPKKTGNMENFLKGTNEENLYTLNFNKKLSKNSEFLIYGNYTDQKYSGKYPFSPSDRTRDYTTHKFYIKPQIKYSYLQNSYVIVGGDFQRATTDVDSTYFASSDWKNPTYDIFVAESMEPKKNSWGGFLFNKYTYNNWEFTQGYRRQDIEIDYFKNQLSENKKFSENAWDFSVNYLLTEMNSIYFSYTTAFRTPNTDELVYWDYSNGLNSQTSKTFEVGSKNTFGNTYLSAALFTTLTENEIFYDASTYVNGNIPGESRRNGAEIFMEHYFSKVTLRESFSYTHTEIKDGKYSGKDIPGVPNFIMNLGGSYNPTEKWTLNGDLNFVGESYSISDFNNHAGKNPSYLTLDLNIRYTVNEAFSIYGGINNLFDKKYSDYIIASADGKKKNYYPANGRNFYVGTTYKF